MFTFGVFLRFILITGRSRRSLSLLHPNLDFHEPSFGLARSEWSLDLPGVLHPEATFGPEVEQLRCLLLKLEVQSSRKLHLCVCVWNACEPNYDGNIIFDTLAKSPL